MAWSFFRGSRQRRRTAPSGIVPVTAPVRELRRPSRPPPLPARPSADDAEDITRHVQLIDDDALPRGAGSQLVLRGARTTQPPPPPAAKVEPRSDAPPSRRVLFHVRRGHWTADAHVLSPNSSARLWQFRDALLARREPGCTVVRVLSGLQGRAGKAHCAAQLAFMLADETGRSVLLVEADIDQPALHRVLDVQAPRGYGLSEQLKRLPRPAAVRVLRDFTRIRLSQSLDAFLESSNVTPAAFDSPQFEALLMQSQLDYDFIVLNGPVVGHWPDTDALQGISSFLFVTDTTHEDEPADLAAISQVLQSAVSLAVIDLASPSDL